MSKTEANKLTNAILKYLQYHGIFCWRQNNGGVYDPVKRTFRSGSSTKGVPDIIAINNAGTFIGIEIKVGKDRLSADQIAFKKKIEEHNAKYIVARTLDDVQEIVQPKGEYD